MKIYNEDCLLGMSKIPDKSVDMILCDLPYGTTDCKWDVIIPFEPLWEQYERVIKDNGAIVLTASQPFTTDLINSNRKMFKYCWIWEKPRPSNYFAAKYQPLNNTEDIIVFSKGGVNSGSKIPVKYNPQGVILCDKTMKNSSVLGEINEAKKSSMKPNKKYKQTITNYPYKTLKFNSDRSLHPTQKPVALFEYLIKTYTNEGETVLDNCMGSGTTAIACMNTNRNFIGFELDTDYFNIAKERIENHAKTQ